MFDMAVGAKKAGLKSGYVEHGLWDKIVFSKVKVRPLSSFFFPGFPQSKVTSLQARLGGRVRLMVTGSAPIKAEVLDFLRLAFACPVIEGYGQTECVPQC
jgi:long-chain acyl-CoA synthetase